MTPQQPEQLQSRPIVVDGPAAGGNAERALVPLGAPPPVMPPAAPTDGAPPQAAAPNARALLAAFRRRWLVATSLGLSVGALAAAIAWYFVPAPYTAFAELHVKAVPEKVLFKTAEAEPGFSTYKQTQMRLVTSPFVLSAALRRPETANLQTFADVSQPVEWLEKELEITSPATEFMRISLSGDNPHDLATLVNAVQDAFLEEVVNAEQNARLERKTKLERIHREVEDRLRSKKSAMKKLAEALGSSDSKTLTVKQQMAVEYFAQLRQEHARIRFDLMRAQTRLAAKKARDPELDEIEIPEAVLEAEVARQPEIQRLSGRVAQLRDLIARTKGRVNSPDHPLLVGYQTELTQAQNSLAVARQEMQPLVEEQLRNTLLLQSESTLSQQQSEVELLAAQEEQLRTELENQKVEANKLGVTSFELESLNKEIAQIDNVAKSLADEIQKLTIELASPVRTTLHRKAEVPVAPDVAKKYRLTAFAGFGSCGLIIAVIVWLEMLAKRINSQDEVLQGLSLRILGSLPIMPSWMTNGDANSRKGRRAVMRSVWTESVDAARTMLLREASTESMRAIMVVSAMGGEGKTTLSCHLATSLARGGRRTLLIDTDMRRPNVHRTFDIPHMPGFCELIRGDVALDDAVRPVSPEGLFVLPAGKIDQETLQLLAKDATEAILERAKAEFDFVILDSAPLLPVTDSLLIGQHVDAALFSVRRDVSRYAKVAAACQRLSMLGVPLLGAVVIGLDETTYGYRYPYRYYGYGAYGSYGSSYGYHLHAPGPEFRPR